MEKSTPFKPEKAFYYLLIALAFSAHYYVLLRYSYNIPKDDDYWDALRFLNDYIDTDSWREKISLIFSQHMEHRTTINRLIYLSMYGVGGELNFKLLKVIGDLATIGIIALLVIPFKSKPYFLFLFALTTTFLLNLQSWGSMLWAMTAISNYFVVFLALATFHLLLSTRRNNFHWALFFGGLCTFTQGNGILIWPIGLLCIFFENGNNRDRKLLFWSIAAALVLSLYFHHYHHPDKLPSPLHDLATTSSAWLKLAHWFLAFVGACWAFESADTAVAAFAGAIICIASVPCVIFLRQRARVLTYFVLFLFFSAALASYSRFSFLGIGESISSRYKIYSVYLSCILLISAYLYLSSKINWQRLIQTSILLIAIAHTLTSYASSLELMRLTERDVADSMRLWLLKHNRLFASIFLPDASVWAVDAIDKRIWDPRSLFSDALYFRTQESESGCNEIIIKGNLVISIRRTSSAAMGELVVDDRPVGLKKIRNVIICRGEHTYIGVFFEPSRTATGEILLHFLHNDPVETADSIFFENSIGEYFAGSISH